MSNPCHFGAVLPRKFPHILEQIFLYLDYESFKTCFEVCKTWKELMVSDRVQREAKDIFYAEIEEDNKKLVRAAREGRMSIIIRLLSINMVDINIMSNMIDLYDEEQQEAAAGFVRHRRPPL